VGSIDAARGAAMLFVFLSHFTAAYFWPNGPFELASYLSTASMVASPTFVIVSGMVIGFLAVTDPSGFPALRIKLVDRGVFILVIGHFLLVLTEGPTFASFGHAYTTSFITDAIAVAIIVGPWLLGAFSSRTRIGLAISLFVLDWWAVVSWHPAGAVFTALKVYVVGSSSLTGGAGAQVFPILPWIAVYLAASVLGERIGRTYATGNPFGAQRTLARVGLVSFIAGSAMYVVVATIRGARAPHSEFASDLLGFLSIYQKFPPGIVYLTFFGGAGVVMLALILEIDRRGLFPWAMNQLRHVGRASLFAFIAEYALYRAFLARIDLPYSPFWPVLFALSVVVLVWAANVWDRRGANRFLTVGIKTLARKKFRPRVSGAQTQADSPVGLLAHPRS
jgi:uncharacterized membrane protein